MSSFQLKAQKREKLGSLEARRIKRAGKIPAVVHSKSGNLNISIDKREFDVEIKKGNIQARVAEIEVDGKKVKSIANIISCDPVSDQIIHVDFVNCADSTSLRAWPKLVFVGRDKSPGIKRGGFLNIRVRKIEVLCDSEAKIPLTIEVDISKVQVGEKIRAHNIKLSDGVKFSNKTDFLIASITGRGKAEVEADAAAAAGAAAGAAGATDAAKKDSAAPKAAAKKEEAKK